MITITTCTHCHRDFKLEDPLLNTEIICPFCQKIFVAQETTNPQHVEEQLPNDSQPTPASIGDKVEKDRICKKGAISTKKFLKNCLIGVTVAGITLFFLIYFSPGENIPDNEWQEFRSVEGKYQVLMPGKPAPRTTKFNMRAVGEITIYYQEVQYDRLMSLFQVGYYDYPEDVDMEHKSTILMTELESTKNEGAGKIIYQKEIVLNGNPGVEFEMEFQAPRHGYVKYQFFIVKRRFYILGVLRIKKKPNEENVEKFLNSFELLEE